MEHLQHYTPCTNLCFNEKNKQDRAGLIAVRDLANPREVRFMVRHVPMISDECVYRLYRDNWYGKLISLVINGKVYDAWNFEEKEIRAFAEGQKVEGAYVVRKENEMFGRRIHSILVQKNL